MIYMVKNYKKKLCFGQSVKFEILFKNIKKNSKASV